MTDSRIALIKFAEEFEQLVTAHADAVSVLLSSTATSAIISQPRTVNKLVRSVSDGYKLMLQMFSGLQKIADAPAEAFDAMRDQFQQRIVQKGMQYSHTLLQIHTQNIGPHLEEIVQKNTLLQTPPGIRSPSHKPSSNGLEPALTMPSELSNALSDYLAHLEIMKNLSIFCYRSSDNGRNL